MASPNEIVALRGKLGVGGGTLVDQWVATAFDYFRAVLQVDPLDPAHVRYLRGIDFHRPVSKATLTPRALLVRFPEIVGGTIQPERLKPYRFFAVPGATPAHLGWNPDEVAALMSFASVIRFENLGAHDARSRLGGDRQVVVPWATAVTLIRARDFDRQELAEMWNWGYRPLGQP